MKKLKVLITGGPTWIKIDDVRILTNVFTGNTAVEMANYFKSKKAQVTLVANLHRAVKMPKGVKIKEFRYYDQFYKILKNELQKSSYDVIIHNAAVSDYRVKNIAKGKIKSKKRQLTLNLSPTKKIIKNMRVWAKKSLIVQFKLEIKEKDIVDVALKSLKDNRSDFVVANAYSKIREKKYKAFLIDKQKNILQIGSKKELSKILYQAIVLRYNKYRLI